MMALKVLATMVLGLAFWLSTDAIDRRSNPVSVLVTIGIFLVLHILAP